MLDEKEKSGYYNADSGSKDIRDPLVTAENDDDESLDEDYGESSAENSNDAISNLEYAQQNAANISKSTFEKVAARVQNRKRIRTVLTIVFSSILLIGVIAVLGKLFFKVSNIVTNGNKRYEGEEIIDSCGIQKGEDLYGFDKKAIETSVIQNCPYVKSVKVYRQLPSTVMLNVEEEIPAFYFFMADEYFVLSDSLRVLEKTQNMGELLLDYPQLKKIKTQPIKRAIVGEKIVFEYEGYMTYAEEMLSIFKNSAIIEHISSIDFSDRLNIFFVYDNKFKIVLGDISDVENKINIAEEIIAKLSPEDNGIINVEESTAFFLMGASIE